MTLAQEHQKQEEDIVPAHLAVKSMRDSGYKNTAYAVAELIDNSVEAGANQIELLCAEKEELVNQRKMSRINQIGVLDNGHGMPKDVLQIALQFGNGTHLKPEDQDGIGKFGMGLPNSSISQCKRVDVWSWQDDPNSAYHTYLDIDEITEQQQIGIPEPTQQPIPHMWKQSGNTFDKSGTLVVWSQLDRCLWKTASSVIDHSELLIGRMYRRFLNRDEISIRLVSFDQDDIESTLDENWARPNDPIYLMQNTSCPYEEEPMFKKHGGNNFERTFSVSPIGSTEEHEVTVRLTFAKEESREGHNPGGKPYGKHAKKNVGVSLVRADRELDLDRSWANPSDPRERWWGVEVEFPPALDELFGVTNNKQAARYFSEMAKMDLDDFQEDDGETIHQIQERLGERENTAQRDLIEIANFIKNRLNVLRNQLRSQTAGKRSRHGNDGGEEKEQNSPEAKGTEATEKRKERGFKGESDKDEEKPTEERKKEIKEELERQGASENEAEQKAEEVVELDFKYTFTHSELPSASLFNVKPSGGSLIITLNVDHPAYEQLVEVLEGAGSELSEDELRTRLYNARDGIRLLLEAWARFEDEQPDGQRRTFAQDARNDWGRMARDFFQ